MQQSPIISAIGVQKRYASGFQALENVDLEIRRGEIFALLGPNGAGKTTLINIICGLVNPSAGKITAGGFDIVKDFRKARALVGLVPQELTGDMFERVWNSVRLSRGLFGKKPDSEFLEKVLKTLSLWEKRNNKIMTLSGGMKRRVMIAKALSHEPSILFLDEPSAGVDVALRRDMWAMVRELRSSGVTIILTTHYIEEAQEMADRIGIINRGKIILIEEKALLMQKLGKKILTLKLAKPIQGALPSNLHNEQTRLSDDGQELSYTFDAAAESGIPAFIRKLAEHNIEFSDLQTKESSLEEIFMSLVQA